MNPTENRRPLKTRQKEWAHKLAHALVGLGMTPNQMSMASVGFAVLGAIFYGCAMVVSYDHWYFLLPAALCIQLRLLANMLDGLMAVEEGKKTFTGVLYNELPDRVADTLFLAAAGYAAGWPDLGWLAAVLAIGTAYLRAIGGSLGYAQDFSGPMAKQHRMFTLTIGTLIAMLVAYRAVLALTLGIIVLGCVLTLINRTRRMVMNLRDHPHA